MRLLPAACLLILLAGCTDRVATEEQAPTLPTVLRERYTAPAEMQVTGTMAASAVVGLSSERCDDPSVRCARHAFTIAAPTYIDAEGRNVTDPPVVLLANATRGAVKVEARLQWSGYSDFDLFIYQGTEAVATAENGPSELAGMETIVAELPAGEYEFVVLGWTVVNDSYRLQATFTAVDGPVPDETASAGA